MSVLGKGELLVSGVTTFHVQGADTDKAYDGMMFFSGELVYLGTKKVGEATLPSWAVPKPITKDQFADALAGAFACRLLGFGVCCCTDFGAQAEIDNQTCYESRGVGAGETERGSPLQRYRVSSEGEGVP